MHKIKVHYAQDFYCEMGFKNIFLPYRVRALKCYLLLFSPTLLFFHTVE